MFSYVNSNSYKGKGSKKFKPAAFFLIHAVINVEFQISFAAMTRKYVELFGIKFVINK